MNRAIRRRPEVWEDIIGLAEYIARDSLETAARFFDAVEATIKWLAEMPGTGALRDFADPRLKNLRSWAVQGFPNHLIFYEVNDATVMVLAVLHGARDLPAALKDRS